MSDVNLYAPLPFDVHDQRGERFARTAVLLTAIEVPDCQCEPPRDKCPRMAADCPGPEACRDCPRPPCEHILGADHSLPLSHWIKLLRDYDGPGYDGPSEHDEPSLAVKRRCRFTLLKKRALKGVRLFNDRDACASSAILSDQIGLTSVPDGDPAVGHRIIVTTTTDIEQRLRQAEECVREAKENGTGIADKIRARAKAFRRCAKRAEKNLGKEKREAAARKGVRSCG